MSATLLVQSCRPVRREADFAPQEPAHPCHALPGTGSRARPCGPATQASLSATLPGSAWQGYAFAGRALRSVGTASVALRLEPLRGSCRSGSHPRRRYRPGRSAPRSRMRCAPTAAFAFGVGFWCAASEAKPRIAMPCSRGFANRTFAKSLQGRTCGAPRRRQPRPRTRNRSPQACFSSQCPCGLPSIVLPAVRRTTYSSSCPVISSHSSSSCSRSRCSSAARRPISTASVPPPA